MPDVFEIVICCEPILVICFAEVRKTSWLDVFPSSTEVNAAVPDTFAVSAFGGNVSSKYCCCTAL